MYDTLARITDNFKIKDSSSLGKEKRYIEYKGAFEPYVRDIDPTILLKETKGNWYTDAKDNYWWHPQEKIQWQMENKDWIDYLEDLPSIKNCIFFKDNENTEWVSLHSSPQWYEPLKKGIKRSETTHKRLWYILISYLIPNKDIEEFKSWADKQIFWDNWMPKANGHHQIFNREFYWSEAYKFFQQPYYGGNKEWSEIDSYSSKGEYLHKIGLTISDYYWECEYDYSKVGALNMQKPSRILFDGMCLRYAKKEGYFIDNKGDLVCFDPSIYYKSQPYLLVKKEALTKFLSDNDLTICWIIIGEKQVIIPNYMYNDDEYIGVLQLSGLMTLDEYSSINIKKSENVPDDFSTKI